MIKRAFEVQWEHQGFSFIEILTMCPTGWFVDTLDAPDYLNSTLGSVYKVGVLKDECASPPIGKMDA
jgi:2-oxoglutarate ferredoxin oxidoreductase subunit beta